MRIVAPVAAAIAGLSIALGAQQKPQTSPTPKPTSSPTSQSSPKSRPNFSGRWTVVSADGAGQVEIVTQDAKTLTTEHASDVAPDQGRGHKMTYQLDGIERRMAIPGRGADVTWLATASWDGDHIVITSKISYPNGMKTQSKEVWSIDAKGQRIVDFTESGPGGSGQTQKVVYVKK